jgi:hypothetical protein
LPGLGADGSSGGELKMDTLEVIRLCTEILTAVGTLALAIVTYRTLMEMRKERTPNIKIEFVALDALVRSSNAQEAFAKARAHKTRV